MQKWEHCLLFQFNNTWRAVYYTATSTLIFSESNSFEEGMQSLVNGGWEMVTVYTDASSTMYWAFKRPAQ
jgi:hypothetical protein